MASSSRCRASSERLLSSALGHTRRVSGTGARWGEAIVTRGDGIAFGGRSGGRRGPARPRMLRDDHRREPGRCCSRRLHRVGRSSDGESSMEPKTALAAPPRRGGVVVTEPPQPPAFTGRGFRQKKPWTRAGRRCRGRCAVRRERWSALALPPERLAARKTRGATATSSTWRLGQLGWPTRGRASSLFGDKTTIAAGAELDPPATAMARRRQRARGRPARATAGPVVAPITAAAIVSTSSHARRADKSLERR